MEGRQVNIFCFWRVNPACLFPAFSSAYLCSQGPCTHNSCLCSEVFLGLLSLPRAAPVFLDPWRGERTGLGRCQKKLHGLCASSVVLGLAVGCSSGLNSKEFRHKGERPFCTKSAVMVFGSPRRPYQPLCFCLILLCGRTVSQIKACSC